MNLHPDPRSVWMDGDRFSDLERPSPLNLAFPVGLQEIPTPRGDRRKVAIIGGGHSRDGAPYEDPAWEIWCCNALRCLDPQGRFRADRWFELHPLGVQDAEDLAWLKACPGPVYMIERYLSVPRAVRYPIERAAAMAPHPQFFGSTFAFEVALAILEGFEEIGLWGVDLAVGREALVERPLLLWWLGLAGGWGVRGRVRVTVPSESTLLRMPHLYGYDYYPEKRWVEQMCENYWLRGLWWDETWNEEATGQEPSTQTEP